MVGVRHPGARPFIQPPPPPTLASLAPPQGAAFSVADVSACASACSADAGCISFSAGAGLGLVTCGIVGECYAPNASSCPSTVAFSCPGGVFSSVEFASCK